jgi:hypothetical protein
MSHFTVSGSGHLTCTSTGSFTVQEPAVEGVVGGGSGGGLGGGSGGGSGGGGSGTVTISVQPGGGGDFMFKPAHGEWTNYILNDAGLNSNPVLGELDNTGTTTYVFEIDPVFHFMGHTQNVLGFSTTEVGEAVVSRPASGNYTFDPSTVTDYTTGVTVDDANHTVTLVVDSNTPTTLYYYNKGDRGFNQDSTDGSGKSISFGTNGINYSS